MSRVVEEVRQFLDRHEVSGPGLVAVSGGADSVALARALLEAGCRELTVAHINHQLRGAESDADEVFVMELAHSLGVKSRSTRIDLGAASENLEAAARRLRYDWLAGLGSDWVATGHTVDDQAETVLHRIIRGSGIQGLRGIAATRRAGGASPLLAAENRGLTPPARPEIIRPLLTVTRSEVLAYLASLDQPYRTDSSNTDPRFTRNRIRHEMLPLLRSFNPEIVSVLGRLAGQAEEVFAELEADARALLAAAELPRAGDMLVLDATALSAAPPHRVRDALRLAWQRESWPADGMTFAHWDRLAGVARGDHPAADFPGGIHARLVGRVVRLGRRS